MGLGAILVGSLWAGLFAGSLAVIFTAARRYLIPAFLCGLVARFVRDVCILREMGPGWATVVAAAVVVWVAVAFTRKHEASPVVLASGVIPLGAAAAVFQSIVGLMKISVLKGAELDAAAVALSGNAGKVFTTTLAIATGLAAGMEALTLFRRGRPPEETGQ